MYILYTTLFSQWRKSERLAIDQVDRNGKLRSLRHCSLANSVNHSQPNIYVFDMIKLCFLFFISFIIAHVLADRSIRIFIGEVLNKFVPDDAFDRRWCWRQPERPRSGGISGICLRRNISGLSEANWSERWVH